MTQNRNRFKYQPIWKQFSADTKADFLQFIRFITTKTILEPLLGFQLNLYVNINIFLDLFIVSKDRAQAGGPYLIKTLPKIKNLVAIFRFGWIIALFPLSYAQKEIGYVLFSYLNRTF